MLQFSIALHTTNPLKIGKFTFNITHCTIKALTCTAQMQECKSLVMISRTVQINRHCIAFIPRTHCMHTLIHPMYFYPFSKNHKFLIPNLVLFTDFPRWSISTFFIIPLQIRRVNGKKKNNEGIHKWNLSLNNKNLSRDDVVQPMPLPGYLSYSSKSFP
jgi:hypothetical protein